MSKSYTAKLTAKIPVKFTFPGFNGHESANPTVDLIYSYTPGDPGVRTYGDPGYPGTGPELDLLSATLIDGDGLDPTDQQVKEWAADWLDDAGYDIACDHAEKCIADLCGNLD